MKTSTKALFAAAAVGGLLAGASSTMAAKVVKGDAGQSVVSYGEKGACSGKDGCKGKESCKAKDKASCKAKDKASCKATTKPAEPAPSTPAPAK